MKKIQFTIPLYAITIIFCWDVDDESYSRFIKQRFGMDASGDMTGDGLFTRFVNTTGGDIGVIAMSTDTFTGTPYQYSVLAHECLHATFRLLKSRGLRYSRASEEAYTYLMDELIEKAAAKALAYEARLLK